MEKILFCRLDGLGDFLQTLPAIQILSEQPHFEVYGCIQAAYLDLVKNFPKIKGWVAYSPQNSQTALKKIKEIQVDHLLCFSYEKNARKFLPKLKGIKNRYTNINGLPSFFFANKRAWQKRSTGGKNEAEYCAQLLSLLPKFPAHFSLSRPKIFLSEEEKQAMTEKIAEKGLIKNQFLVLHLGMRGSAMNWPFSYYQSFLQKILQKGYKVALTGWDEEECKKNQALVQEMQNKNLVDFSKLLKIRELACFLHLANLVFAPSTGVLHLANAVGTRILSLYPPASNQSALRWAPYGYIGEIITPGLEQKVRCPAVKNCWGSVCPFYPCLETISPDFLVQKWAELSFFQEK